MRFRRLMQDLDAFMLYKPMKLLYSKKQEKEEG